MMTTRSFALIAAGLALAVASSAARAADPVTIELAIKDAGFEPATIKAPADTPINLSVLNETAAPAEFESGALKVEKVVAAKGKIIVRLRPLAKGRYEFVDEYRNGIKGTLIVE